LAPRNESGVETLVENLADYAGLMAAHRAFIAAYGEILDLDTV
jgi:hypothetical protein